MEYSNCYDVVMGLDGRAATKDIGVDDEFYPVTYLLTQSV